METKEGSIRATLPWNLPIDQRACHTPWNPDQPYADWMPPSYRRWITLGGLSPPPNPVRQPWSSFPPKPNH